MTSSTGAAALTLTVSRTAATPSWIRRFTVWPTVSCTAFFFGSNPWISVVSSYEPTGSSSALNSPSASVTMVRLADVPVLTTVTVTPGTAAPDWSSTAP